MLLLLKIGRLSNFKRAHEALQRREPLEALHPTAKRRPKDLQQQ